MNARRGKGNHRGVASTNRTKELFVPFALCADKFSLLRALRVLRGGYAFTVNPEEPNL